MVNPKKLNNISQPAKINLSINGILGLVSFSTIFPIKRYVSIAEMSGSIIIWPYIGLFIGAIVAIVSYILNPILGFSSLLSAVLIYSFVEWFTGFNHLDGIVDMGDGLMVHGDHEKRLSVMRDSMVGTGGISTLFIICLITISVLSEIPFTYLIPSILLMETTSKLGMLTTMCFGTSDTKGIGAEIKKGISINVLLPTIMIVAVIGYLLLNVIGLMSVMAAVIMGLFMSYVGQKNFGCVTGDILGASNEVSRMVTLLFILINLHMF